MKAFGGDVIGVEQLIRNVELYTFACIMWNLSMSISGFMETITPVKMFSILVLNMCGRVYIEKMERMEKREGNMNMC